MKLGQVRLQRDFSEKREHVYVVTSEYRVEIPKIDEAENGDEACVGVYRIVA